MLTLKLFNSVLEKESTGSCYVSNDGYIIEPGALWAKERIIDYYAKEKLSGNDLNKTFHKSWAGIKNSSRYELFLQQIRHYFSTYGSNFQDEVYIPDEVLNLPNVKLTYKVIRARKKSDLVEKCLYMLKSGIALKEETINELITVLVDELDYSFTGSEGIKNKEAIVKIADMYGVLPSDTMEFFRYIVYRTTGESLLIKNDEMRGAISCSNFNPQVQFYKFGLEKLAEIFNRFKPLFLAYKNKCPKTINKISKLSKTCHKPLISNPLNSVTNEVITDKHWLDNATVYAIFKALSACYSRMKGQDSFVYRIRNGKSWTTTSAINKNVCQENYNILIEYLKDNYDLSGYKILIPDGIKYSLPTSEKMFVGNVPTGTRFYGKKMAVGIYWENSWGARDLDLSGVNLYGKVGWNSHYSSNGLMYSGDITSAPNGAVEYLYAGRGLDAPTLVQNNVYNGENDCKYKIIIGVGSKVSKEYMMNPNKVFAAIPCESVQKQTILGMMIPKAEKQCFVLLNFGAGHVRVSGNSELSEIATKALYQQWSKPLSFNKIVKLLGAEIVEDNYTHDFSLNSIEKDSFIRLFKK